MSLDHPDPTAPANRAPLTLDPTPTPMATTSGPDLPAPIRLSQGLLTLLATCPRKFQHLYIEQMNSYTLPDEQLRLMAGSQFHALLQQWQLGLPVEPLAASDRQLEQWFTTFIAGVPDILGMAADTARLSEQPRTLEFEGYLLTVVYDLLVLGAERAQILDWKTYARPENLQRLRQHWQTRLYLFVLVETSQYAPEQVTMVYWFFPGAHSRGEASRSEASRDEASTQESINAGQRQRFEIAYNHQQHEQTRADLSRLLSRLTDWVTRYQMGELFPQVVLGAAECGQCTFAWRCDRGGRDAARSEPELVHGSLELPLSTLMDLEKIDEIPL